MCTIIEIKKQWGGWHRMETQSHRTECWKEGWVEVPQMLVIPLIDCGGICDLVLDEDGELVSIIPRRRPWYRRLGRKGR